MAHTKKTPDVPTDRLDEMLARLKLSGIRDQLDSLLDEATRANLSARETLAMLCEREIARKDHRRIDMALKLAHFPAIKELAGFDFEAQPSIDPRQIRDLAASRWIANGENVLLLGPPGVGKTHLAIALGREAILAGYSVQFTTAMALVATLAKAHGEKRLDEKLLALSKAKLLIVDELGYLPLEPDAAHLFFQLVSRRYEAGAMLITSNRSVAEWGTVFADPVVATAILDRLLHHSHVLTIRGDSYRLRAKRKSGLIKASAGDGPSVGSASLRSDGSRDLVDLERFHQAQNLHELALALLAHTRFQKTAQGRELFRQLPTGQRRGLIQRVDLTLDQRQVVQRLEHEVLALVGARMACDHLGTAGDYHLMDIAAHKHLAVAVDCWHRVVVATVAHQRQRGDGRANLLASVIGRWQRLRCAGVRVRSR